jgi:hypothetical protein
MAPASAALGPLALSALQVTPWLFWREKHKGTEERERERGKKKKQQQQLFSFHFYGALCSSVLDVDMDMGMGVTNFSEKRNVRSMNVKYMIRLGRQAWDGVICFRGYGIYSILM